jgi:hypothetical protein
MGLAQTQEFCEVCGRQTLHARESFSEGMGCLLTLLTGGLFLPLWIILTVRDARQPWRCQTCGQEDEL